MPSAFFYVLVTNFICPSPSHGFGRDEGWRQGLDTPNDGTSGRESYHLSPKCFCTATGTRGKILLALQLH